jgi:flagellar biosynthesis chaperone FliJ
MARTKQTTRRSISASSYSSLASRLGIRPLEPANPVSNPIGAPPTSSVSKAVSSHPYINTLLQYRTSRFVHADWWIQKRVLQSSRLVHAKFVKNIEELITQVQSEDDERQALEVDGSEGLDNLLDSKDEEIEQLQNDKDELSMLVKSKNEKIEKLNGEKQKVEQDLAEEKAKSAKSEDLGKLQARVQKLEGKLTEKKSGRKKEKEELETLRRRWADASRLFSAGPVQIGEVMSVKNEHA